MSDAGIYTTCKTTRMVAVKSDVFAQLRFIHDSHRWSYSDVIKMLLDEYYKNIVKEDYYEYHTRKGIEV